MEPSYLWSWWVGALALSFLTVGAFFFLGRPLGVSRYWGRLVRGPKEDQLLDDPSALQAALLEATREEFGCEVEASPTQPTKAPVVETFSGAAAFLGMLIVGGALASWVRGDFQWRTELGESFQSSFGAGPLSWAVLLLGGVFVGFGTRLCGGCTSGHGLSGCSRLHWNSFVAVASFFASGVLVSFLLGAL